MCGFAAPALAADVSAYGRLPAIENVALSPNGERLAYISMVGDQQKLVVLGLPDKVILNTPAGNTKVQDLFWAGDDHLLIKISNTTQGGIYEARSEADQYISVNVNTGNTFIVFRKDDSIYKQVYGYFGSVNIGNHWYGFFSGVSFHFSTDSGWVLGDMIPDLYRVDLDADKNTKIEQGNGRRQQWVIDGVGTAIVRGDYDDNLQKWSIYGAAPTHQLISEIHDPLNDHSLGGLGHSPGTVEVWYNQPQEMSLTDGKLTDLPVKAPQNIAAILHNPLTGIAVGVRYIGDTPSFQFFDPVVEARYEGLRKALGATLDVVSWSADFHRIVVETQGRGDSGTFWLIDGGQANIIDNPYPDIPGAIVGERRIVTYKASDGLEIHGVLTLPPGHAGRNLPVVVMPHGGPESKDDLQFDPWAQAFATQGYAVFQPNFRGSTGYSVEFRDAGYGEWGRKMQTDISDGLAELAQQGIVDPKRACIVGASYGGYAALAGVTVQQGLYRCAVSIAGISDLNEMLGQEHRDVDNEADADIRTDRKFLGVKTDGDPVLQAFSPARLAARADAPILLIHGEDDTTVPPEQSRIMEKALHAGGKSVEMIFIKGEDHHFSRQAGRVQMLQAAVDFVIKHNPPDPAPTTAAAAAPTAPGSSR